MREYKFRIWDLVSKKFLPTGNKGVMPSYMISLSGDVIYGDFTGQYYIRSTQDDYVIQQFTGHTDKNGKDIYEGDIVYDRVSCNMLDKEMGLFVIERNEVYSAFVMQSITKENWKWNWIRNISSNGKVMGNIFENKDLLK